MVIGALTQIAEGVVQWQIKEFTSLREDDDGYPSTDFSFAGGDWWLRIRRPSWKRCELIQLSLFRWRGGAPPTLKVAYTFYVKDRNSRRQGERRNRMEFGWEESSPWIGIMLEDERMSDLVPGNTLTVLCHLQRIDPTQEAGSAQLTEKLQEKTAELNSVRREPAEKEFELVRSQRLIAELNRKIIDLETNKDNAQKLFETEKATQLKELVSVRRELAESLSELVRSQRLIEELNLKVIDLEADRDNAQKLLQTKSEDYDSGSSSLLQKNKVLRDLKDLLHKKELCDVVLKVQGQEFPALKAILMVRSPVLASTFQSDMKERATGVVEIEDCDPSSFSDFLCYLYCGALENLSSKNVFNLFSTADKYDVQDLRSECLEFVKQNLSVDTFCDTITLALRHSETELIKLCTDFFVKNATMIITTVRWQTFNAENPTHGNELFIKFATSVGRSNE